MKTLKRVLGTACAAAMLLGMSTAFAIETGAGAMLKVDNAKERPAPISGPTMLASQSGAITVLDFGAAIPTQGAPIAARDTKLNLPLIAAAANPVLTQHVAVAVPTQAMAGIADPSDI